MRIGFWILCLAIGLSGMSLVLWRFSPHSGGPVVVSAAYTAMFLVVYGFASLAGYGLRRWLWKRQAQNEAIRTAGRQGFLLGLLCVAVLLLLAADLFNLWTAAVLMVLFLFLELYGR